ncbi:transferrin-binding protein-like solute binding protein [Actinobacillus equuli subsp. equuli]|nr:transferrin-binding protein-like solute binding protein [Actinobacillus equuli]WGE43779.1 transferrin-binding protein-like solute binding protein [Actinobacillus equuli subsp. equuli]
MKSHLASTYNEEIEGKIFDITTENGKGKVGSLPRKSTGSDFEHMRYGYYTDKDGKTSLFVQGYLTPTTAAQTGEETKSPFNYWDASRGNNSSPQPLYSLPVEKVYEYKGTTFYGNGNQYAEYATTAYADFDNKKVQVNVLNTTGENKLTFGGNINNNTFEGTHNGIVTKGAFFGKRASDIGGIFYQTEGAEKGNNGVFGATQQNCGYSSCTPIENKNLKTFEIK